MSCFPDYTSIEGLSHSRFVADRSCGHVKQAHRPLVIVAHSLGGLVAAQLFNNGEQSSDDTSAKAIAKSIRGLVFLGTPFQGSIPAGPAESARRILKLLGVETQEHTLKMLGANSESINDLTRTFSKLLNKRRMSKSAEDQINAFFFYETLATRVGGLVSFAQVSIRVGNHQRESHS